MMSAPQATKARRKQQSVVVQGGEIGLLKGGQFQGHTNFVVEVAYAVQSPTCVVPRCMGYVYTIKTLDGVLG